MTIIAAIIVAVIGFAVGYAMGRARRADALRTTPFAIAEAPVPTLQIETAHESASAPAESVATTLPVTPSPAPSPASSPATSAAPPPSPLGGDRATPERARLIRSYEAEAASVRRTLAGRDAALGHLTNLAEERRRLFDELAAARTEAARYRQLVVDLENNAAPQFFGAGAPDDLKLIVGIGPVLERMLQMMGVTTYRQIARWSERDIDEFDAKLHEFPGRIRRDAWVTQARALHQSKYGEALPLRGRG